MAKLVYIETTVTSNVYYSRRNWEGVKMK